MNTEIIYSEMLDFFIQWLDRGYLESKEKDIFIQSKPSKAYLCSHEGQLVFSLEGLYQHLKFTEHLTFNQFRKLIFHSELNKDLATYHVKVINYQQNENDELEFFHLYNLVKI